ncbi:hypothetical protein BD289DRAFT_422258 [Coniella lustricola]|uniref:OTU domain-containing protein n=1 Tax=Coniella lustricola TaxID=2025994 RepID=A0A2T3AKR4_9PEZI|nr:hypothetical protein BD289DRAFT_422258 [Coniella lustricola]
MSEDDGSGSGKGAKAGKAGGDGNEDGDSGEDNDDGNKATKTIVMLDSDDDEDDGTKIIARAPTAKRKGKAGSKAAQKGKSGVKRGKKYPTKNNGGNNDDDKDGKPSKAKPIAKKATLEDHQFYGLPATASAQDIRLKLYFQDRTTNIGEYPHPAIGSRFNFDQLIKELNIDVVQQSLIERHEAYAAHKTLHCRTLETSLTDHWLKNPVPDASLLRGFPMMEEVVFFRSANDKGCASDCYWKAVAQHMYGNYGYSMRVKAEHLEFFTAVLLDDTHPRYADYNTLNKTFVDSQVTFGGKAAPTRVNLYQQMRVPRVWTSDAMFQVTADLYNLFIVNYRLDARDAPTRFKKKKTKLLYAGAPIMYGSYNARHVFFLYVDNNHYQPMTPNDFFASEFQTPRPTFDSTFGYESTTRRIEKAQRLSTSHPWRLNTATPGLEIGNGAPSHLMGPDKRAIRAVLTGDPMGTGDLA